jgi:hypothetical protein
MLEEINARLERVWPGFLRVAGLLVGPSTILNGAVGLPKSDGKDVWTLSWFRTRG